MNYWLLKSEPDVFSIEDLKRKGAAPWDGVRNYQARNFLRSMKKGDPALFYHSNAKPSAIVGVMIVAREAYPDPTQFDPKSSYYDKTSDPANPRWSAVDLKFKKIFPKTLPLDEIKKTPALKEMFLFKNGRLSVQPVTPAQWDAICRRCKTA